jgi:hypothetical protein
MPTIVGLSRSRLAEAAAVLLRIPVTINPAFSSGTEQVSLKLSTLQLTLKSPTDKEKKKVPSSAKGVGNPD